MFSSRQRTSVKEIGLIFGYSPGNRRSNNYFKIFIMSYFYTKFIQKVANCVQLLCRRPRNPIFTHFLTISGTYFVQLKFLCLLSYPPLVWNLCKILQDMIRFLSVCIYWSILISLPEVTWEVRSAKAGSDLQEKLWSLPEAALELDWKLLEIWLDGVRFLGSL